MTKLIVFAEDWGAHPSSTQHLMPYIAEDVDVIWVNSIGLRRPSLNWRDMARMIGKVTSRIRQNKTHKPQTNAPFPVVAPMLIPLPKNRLERWLNKKLFARQIRPYLNADDDVWVWTSLPSAIEFEGLFHEQGWVYYCGDDFNALAGVDHHRVARLESQLIRKAQKVWAASRTLARRLNSDTVSVVEHGVDHRLFATPAPRPPEIPIEQKTLGFYGALADWIDQPLLEAIAKQLPDWRIMLIGPTLVNVDRLKAIPNVQYLPALPHKCLPAYLQHWDAAILPFKNNEQIRACNPLKLREYLASGTPILSTDFPALTPYRTLVNVISSAEQAAGILASLPEMEPQCLKTIRQQSVIKESWQHRAGQIRNDLSQIAFAK